MNEKTKLLVNVRRISDLFSHAIREGPDGTLEGKYGEEHPVFTHYLVSYYLSGCLAYLESEKGKYSWNSKSSKHADFDEFIASLPSDSKERLSQLGICKASLNALAQVRNAVVHNDGDLSKNDKKTALQMVREVHIPGVSIEGSQVTLTEELIDFVRNSTVAVRSYLGGTSSH
ncbi:hypothetical protein [Ruegeria sp. HKCCD7221]|uniref:hypothetical protein n=1 Tax=Ruegeria sp. HKCCD7221 TaxID=2683009 RepID=UPI0014896384|nr:hypothetical protein [Ruegeria sp. HKCCD7221]